MKWEGGSHIIVKMKKFFQVVFDVGGGEYSDAFYFDKNPKKYDKHNKEFLSDTYIFTLNKIR